MRVWVVVREGGEGGERVVREDGEGGEWCEGGW